MHTDPNAQQPAPRGGLGGSLRVLASLCILLLAGIGTLVVLEVIPRSVFAEMAGKVAAIGGIAVIAALAIGLLSRR
jgi:hypothetical protein